MSLVVERAAGLATVQDLGRRGHMHEAVPPGGALVPELLRAANRRARNRDDAAALEVLGELVVRAEQPLHVATADAASMLAAGEAFVVASAPRRVAYLAVRGGIHAPLVLGGRGTLLCGKLGAPLRAGDRVAILDEPAAPVLQPPAPPDTAAPIRVIAGPDRDAFDPRALAILARAPYRILPASDRVGTRLAGAPLPRTRGAPEVSRPMVRGALEVPADGQPIVLGPEHPTTGGYPIVGVIAHADLGRFFAIALGGEVTFALT